MMFSNAFSRPVALSKIGDLFSGGWTKTVDTPSPTKTVEAPKAKDVSEAKPEAGSEHLDQSFIDSKVDGFQGPGQASGTKQPGGADDANAHESLDLANYKETQQKKWQAQKDAEARDKLFGQPTSGRVDGKEVAPFSQRTLEDNAEGLVKASVAKANRALPLEIKNIAKVAGITAGITVPLTVGGTFLANIALEAVKPLINPPTVPATEQSVRDGRLVDHVQKNVFLLANTLADLRSEAHVQPSLEWLAKTNEERMDYLDTMLDFIELALANEGKKVGVACQPASTGAQEDDIKSRAIGFESRMAALTALMGAMKVKIESVDA